MIYKCLCCNYTTHDKSAFSRHLLSQKHKNKTMIVQNKSHFCDSCSASYSSRSNLTRHMKACAKKQTIENSYEKEISALKSQLALKNETTEVLKDQVTHLKLMINNAGAISASAMSAISYVTKNYSNAPALLKLEDYAVLKDDQSDYDFIDGLIYEQKKKRLHIYLGNFIIESYKKTDPKEQSVWNSDVNRLTYLIKQIMTDSEEDTTTGNWTVDKKGLKTVQSIIKPVIEYIDPIVRDYINNFEVNYRKDDIGTVHYLMSKQTAVVELLLSIEDGTLSENILKYIAPHFTLDKVDVTKLVK